MRLNDYRNPQDFTPRSVYEEMDRQAAYARRERFFLKIAYFGGVVAFFLGFVMVLKLVSR